MCDKAGKSGASLAMFSATKGPQFLSYHHFKPRGHTCHCPARAWVSGVSTI